MALSSVLAKSNDYSVLPVFMPVIAVQIVISFVTSIYTNRSDMPPGSETTYLPGCPKPRYNLLTLS
jgi:hypothetical protein